MYSLVIPTSKSIGLFVIKISICDTFQVTFFIEIVTVLEEDLGLTVHCDLPAGVGSIYTLSPVQCCSLCLFNFGMTVNCGLPDGSGSIYT